MTSVTVRGPFFHSDVPGMVKDAIKEAVRDVSEYGVGAVQAELYPGHGVLSGRFRSKIKARKVSSRFGGVYVSGKERVKGTWLEGTSRRNQTTRFKGYSSFRRGTEKTDRQAQRIADAIFKNLVRKID